ncbi:GNAT family N-acetyltransferase [Streptomyces sp. NBC_01198]|uniref:GNAT family N-acetyltransferase n=1 Tax=Streptomyces sp. NBC_01198 TaxID=2903769 RepID=UPI002E0D7C12|nr:GNAT family N-acetyltransferase [Streptomyces sp. NBC_01198]
MFSTLSDELSAHSELPTDDALSRWAARDRSAGRVFTRGAAVAVAAPGLSLRDRLVVTGPAADAIPLVRDVLAEVGRGYRPFGDRGLVDALVVAVPGLRPTAGFGWMDRTGSAAVPPDGTAGWLPPAAAPQVGALLDRAFPDSYAYPGRPGAGDRWAGILPPGGSGTPLAVAALAWCAPSVGLLAGVATDPAARGRGLGRRICAFVLAEALAAYGTAALVVADDNTPALRLYRSLGLAYRPLRAAAFEA